jgi:leucyl aminopeptidase
MRFEVKSASQEELSTDLLVIFLDKELNISTVHDEKLLPLLNDLKSGFEQKTIKKEYFSRWSEGGVKHILVFHTALNSSYNIWERIKIFASKAVNWGGDFNLANVTFLLNGQDGATYFGKAIEGIILGSYSFDKYKVEKNRYLDGTNVSLVSSDDAFRLCSKKFERYSLVSQITNECRDLVNEPGCIVYPEVMGEAATQIGRKHDLKVTVFDEKMLRKGGYTGLTSVGKGSSHPPCLISLEYESAKESTVQLSLVGKGITFDTGGISIKPSDKMLEMKGDMAGGAAVLYAMKAVAQLKPSINVVGIIPSAENSPDGNAQRPGDIFTAKNGKSIQVDNTDAEGRLVLIDGFARAGELKATHIVDIATLTGAVVRALGQGYAGIMGNNQQLIDAVIRSGMNHGENFWQLPLPEEYKELLKTPYADINNVGGPNGGAITAGLFLQEFLPEKTAWAHLDIAGPFLFDKPWKYYSAGATGFGVKTFVDLCERFEDYALS